MFSSKTRSLVRPSRLELWTAAGLAAVLLFFVVSGFIAYANVSDLRTTNQRVIQTHTVMVTADELLSAVQDAETGQRGYVLTGDARYLAPYERAQPLVTDRFETLVSLTADNPRQRSAINPLKRHLDSKMGELARIVAVRRAEGLDAARAIILTDQGKTDMDAIRDQIAAIRAEVLRQRQQWLVDMETAYRTALVSGLLSALFGGVLTIAVFLLIRRSARARTREDWLQTGKVGLTEAMGGDLTIEELSAAVLAWLSRYVGAQAAALFKGEAGHFRRAALLGAPTGARIPTEFRLREGLLGQVAADGRPTLLHDVPEDFLTIGSALGEGAPRHLVIAPTRAEGVVNGVIELGFLHEPDALVLQLLTEAEDAIGVALRSARYRSDLQNALEETQRQAEELQVQSEELRVSNEELEEQSRALKESQARLEQQQVELEQTNSQLEEQAQTLETQKDDLERASAELNARADQLEQASQYKSDFLANMSHELRTPLNSLLILSKLLGDNADGNLSEEQVRYANTIQSSGNDLLTLINDILDLSKIEAGHIQVRPEGVSLQRVATDLDQLFRPVAEERGLDLAISIDADVPDILETDRQRLEQILKNLLSNACKFTEAGSVRLAITADGDSVRFAVEDTGIGISPDQQAGVFEAFQQADGGISRRFGGTGLGLSISRELARLLGGSIALRSAPGEGSTFTLSLPQTYAPAAQAPAPAPQARATRTPKAAGAPKTTARAAPMPRAIEDDRNALTGSRRLLLVIEDDDRFAGIVRDLSRELGFQCLVAGTAEDALVLARRHSPSAIVLDIGLPDQSGLTVLDSLKRDDKTRHIPIHIVSAEDHSQTALALGARGYTLKPVKREDLSEVLSGLEKTLERTVRRVLVVEDDQVQREAVQALLASDQVETVGVGSAAECLAALAEQTFDCMVLDLSLPDASGTGLLETLSRDHEHAYPPVIVYTGQDLSAELEQQLRRYSSSIIIKGAKSPERLLDEVSLFLHQVVSDLPPEQQSMIRKARNRDAVLEGRRILIVEDDVRNVYSLTNVLEPKGALVDIARNGQEALDRLEAAASDPSQEIDLVLMDVMMPVMDGLTATRRIREDSRFGKLPILMLTAKAMPDDQERCLAAGANDYMAKPLDVDKLLSLVRVWMSR
ncbi:response regulator [Brevundimonas sp. GCM10030266]|uniref:response regulator n=1 Tax=Brevundimonas sp. GCM10030266 TaxID=3273386 RepID=UPI003610481C